MPRIITWNMEGGTHDNESKWVTGVIPLLAHADADVVALQEAGALPRSAAPVAPPLPPWLSAVPGALVWTYATWTPGHTTYHILWAQTDPAGNRVNLALVSKAAPAGFWYVAPGLAAGRPAIGYQIGADNVISLHALSGGGGDAGGLVTNTAAAVGGGASWVAAGDYNREPPWATPAGNLCPPNKPTRWKSKKKLDYVVRSGPVVTGTVLEELVLSDHFPVVFDV